MKNLRVALHVLFAGLIVLICGAIACGASGPSDTLEDSAQTETVTEKLSAPVPMRGTNTAGGEMQWGANNPLNPVSGTDYLFVSHQDIDYLAGKGVGFIRLIFSWEGCQPNGINTPFATTGNNGTYVATFKDRVAYATSKGMTVMIEPHGADTTDFARYEGNLVGSSQVPDSAFANFWGQLATMFGPNSQVVFGLSNEPNTMSTVQWFQAAQAAIVGIRQAGATNLILVPGNGWTGASSWTSNWYDTASPAVSNATAYLQYIHDPDNNVAVSVHSYFDANDGGGGTDIVSPTIGVDRLSVTVNWARANGVKVHLSEFGTDTSSAAQVAVTNLLTYINQNTDVMLGWSWWAYGPPAWWSQYQFTLDPTNNYTVDQPQMGWLSPFFVAPTPPPAVKDSGAVDSGPADSGVVDSGVDAGPKDAGTQDSGAPDSGVTDAGPKDSGAADASTVLPMVISAKKTYDWQTGLCVQFFFKNPNTQPLRWTKMTIRLGDSQLRGYNSVWGGIFSNNYGTGTVYVTPDPTANPVDDPIPADGKSHQAVGLCANYGSSHYVPTSGGLTY